MTTVIITSPRPNHQLLRVSVLQLRSEGWVETFHVILDEGESFQGYVYEQQRIVTSEMPKPGREDENVPHHTAQPIVGGSLRLSMERHDDDETWGIASEEHNDAG